MLVDMLLCFECWFFVCLNVVGFLICVLFFLFVCFLVGCCGFDAYSLGMLSLLI